MEDGSNLLLEDGSSFYVIEGAEAEEVAHDNVGGWAVASFYDRYRAEQLERERERKKALEAIKNLEGTDSEIAKLLHKQLEREARDKEIAALEQMVQSTYTQGQADKAKEYSEKVAKAYTRAAIKGGFSAVEAFEREMNDAREQEEFLFLAMILLS